MLNREEGNQAFLFILYILIEFICVSIFISPILYLFVSYTRIAEVL